MLNTMQTVIERGWVCGEGLAIGDPRPLKMGTALRSKEWEGYLVLTEIHVSKGLCTFTEMIEVDGKLLLSHPHMLDSLPDDVEAVQGLKPDGKALKDCNPGCAIGDLLLMSRPQAQRRGLGR